MSAAEAAVLEVDSATKIFVDRTLRLALEVLDHRRPVAQLVAVAEAPVVSAIRTLVRADLAPGRTLGAAVLTRVDVVMVDAAAAEVCAAYDRSRRHFALAARITHTRAKGWRLSVLRLF
ncbi:Rv3235 family protein [Nocardia sp. GCM10030253]|uniref:Rv3235 family protein n=1 Tax=Nocardia sp. GCM10030253 TaxID=3273404 RepID=UPI00362EE65C